MIACERSFIAQQLFIFKPNLVPRCSLQQQPRNTTLQPLDTIPFVTIPVCSSLRTAVLWYRRVWPEHEIACSQN